VIRVHIGLNFKYESSEAIIVGGHFTRISFTWLRSRRVLDKAV